MARDAINDSHLAAVALIFPSIRRARPKPSVAPIQTGRERLGDNAAHFSSLNLQRRQSAYLRARDIGSFLARLLRRSQPRELDQIIPCCMTTRIEVKVPCRCGTRDPCRSSGCVPSAV
jgi:hypothetical protein